MKRLLILLIAFASIVGIGLSALPWLISSKGIEARLSERIAELTGLDVTYQGNIQLTLVPFLGLEIENVNLVDPVKPELKLLQVDQLRMRVQLLPLLAGRIKFSTYNFVRPSLSIIVDNDNHSNWHLREGTISKYISTVADTRDGGETQSENSLTQIEDVVIGQFVITDGTIYLRRQSSTEEIKITNLNADVFWPNLSAGWSISGSGVWKGETFTLSNSAQTPVNFMAGGKSETTFEWQSASLTGNFSGEAQFLSGVYLQGQGGISTPSLSRLSKLLEINLSSQPILSEVSLQGKINANSGEIRFDEATAQLDGNQATGLLQLNWKEDHRARISGTLAFDTLDFTPFLDRLPEELPNNEEPHIPGDIDYDVRISASQTKFRDQEFGLFAATAVVQKQEWSLDIGEAAMFGGSLSGTVSATKNNEDYLLNLKGQVNGLGIGELSKNYYQKGTFIDGKANASFDLSAKTHAVTKNLRNYTGSIKVKLTDGQIVGLDLRKAIPALVQTDGVVTAQEMIGNTPFSKLSSGILISNGVAWLSKAPKNSDDEAANDFDLFGKFDFLHGGLAIYADIAGEDNPAVNKRIFIGGTFDNPLVTRTPASSPIPIPSTKDN